MKFTVDADAFKAALAIAGRVVPARSPWPILSNIVVRADGPALTITATNSDLSYEATVAADITDPGEALIPFASLSKFVSAAKGKDVSLIMADMRATVKSGRGRITLSCADAGDYPHFAPAGDDLHTFDREAFLHALRFCGNSASDEEVKYHINGVMIEERGDGLHFWGTDGRVLTHAGLPNSPTIGGGGQVPQDAIQIVASIAGKADTIRFMVCDTGWVAQAGDIRAWGKVIDAKYPDTHTMVQAVRGSIENHAFVLSSELVSALDVAVIGSDAVGNTRHVVMRADEGGPVVLRGLKPGNGAVHAGRAEAEGEIKSPFAVALDAGYLRNTVTGMARDELTISTADRGSIHIEPRNASNTMPLEALIYPIRASHVELADV